MNFPNDEQRHTIIGPTGSGKTIAALWHLSLRDYGRKPWLIYNFKNDKNIDGIPYARSVSVDEIPIKPGVYVAHPLPHQQDEIENQMWEIWRRGNMGVYVDEGYMVGKYNPAFRALLTQGRSLHIPMITLSQRPVHVDLFVFSESEFIQIFPLRNKRDIKNVQEFVPANVERSLPPYHSYYYEVGANGGQGKLTVLKPVPPIEKIYATFASRLERIKKVL